MCQIILPPPMVQLKVQLLPPLPPLPLLLLRRLQSPSLLEQLMPNLIHQVQSAIHVPNTQLFASLTHSINHAKPMVLIELRPAKEMINRGIQNWMDYMRFIKSHS